MHRRPWSARPVPTTTSSRSTPTCAWWSFDTDNRPVTTGAPSAKVLLTNLYNLTQPLIRYELTDTFIGQPDAVEHGYLRAKVQGRADDVLHYDMADIHPIVIRSVMVKTPHVIDYQVRQTHRGIDLFAVTANRSRLDGLAEQLRQALDNAGLRGAEVSVRPVERLDRHPTTGKLRRFVPITTA